MKVTVEAYMTESEIVQALTAKYQFYDFTAMSTIRYETISSARHCCTVALAPKENAKGDSVYKVPQNTTDFGTLVAARLEPYVIVAEGKTWSSTTGVAPLEFGGLSVIVRRRSRSLFAMRCWRSSCH